MIIFFIIITLLLFIVMSHLVEVFCPM